MKGKAFFLIIMCFLIIGFVIAQPPPPPTPSVDPDAETQTPTIPNESVDENNSNTSNESLPETVSQPDSPALGDEDALDDSIDEHQDSELPAVSNNKNNIPVYVLSFLAVLILGIVVYFLIRRHNSSNIQTQTIQSNNPSHAQNTQYEDSSETQRLKNYIDSCRKQGFNDDDIKLQLLKEGHSTDEINRLF